MTRTVEKNGLPEIDRKFLAYNIRTKGYTICTRLKKEKYEGKEDSNLHISPDGEFYSGENRWIYSIPYDTYVYLDELNLISEKTIKIESEENKKNIEDIKSSFILTFGEELGSLLAKKFTIYTPNKDSKIIKCGFPFSLRWAQPGGADAIKYPLKGVEINTCYLEDCLPNEKTGIEKFYEKLISLEIESNLCYDIVCSLQNYNFGSYENDKIKGEKIQKNIKDFQMKMKKTTNKEVSLS